MDRVCKNPLLSTKRVFFVDKMKMSELRLKGLNYVVQKGKRKCK